MAEDDGELLPAMEAVRVSLERLRATMPQSASVAGLGVRDKAPFIAVCLRESLYWRVEELARNAESALERGDEATGILLARGVVEATAMTWRLRQLIERRGERGLDALRDDLRRMWVGGKLDPPGPDAFNVLTFVDHLEGDLAGSRRAYDTLSEYAHPNWSGVAGLYCRTDYEEHTAYFGRQARGSDATDMAASLLAGTLAIFEHAYNALASLILEWTAELAPI